MSRVHKFATGALVASEVLKVLPMGLRYRKPVRMLAAATGQAAGFALRWAMVYAGQSAADDPHLARAVTRSDGPATPATEQLPNHSTKRQLPETDSDHVD